MDNVDNVRTEDVKDDQLTGRPFGGGATVADLADRLKQARLDKRLSWPKYAKLLDISMTTLIKVATGKSKRPHETTLAHLERKLAQLLTSDHSG